MSSKLQAGAYKGTIIDWGLQEVEAIKQLKVVISFSIESESVYWEGFLLKKDGTPNEKTLKTLKTCGFNSKNIMDLSGATALNNKKTYDLTLISIDGYLKVEWVNDPDSSNFKKTDVNKLKGYDLRAVNNFLSANQKEVKNHAPSVEEEIGF